MSITNEFLQARIDAIKADIIELETAYSSILADEMSNYTMNTGQGVVTVTKLSIGVISTQIDVLLVRMSGYEMRMTGSQVRHARAAW